MNCVLITLLVFVFVFESSADNTELQKSSKQKKSFAEEFAAILGVFSFASVATLISPYIVKAGFIPLIFITKLISKPLIMIGLTGWLMVALTPAILAKSGVTSPVFETRSQGNHMFSSIGRLLSTNMSDVTTETMKFFNLDNEECKLEISCRLGKKLASTIPYVQYFVSQSGAGNWIEQTYMAKMVRSMTDSNDCSNRCQSLNGDHKLSTATYSTDSSDSVNNVLEWLG